MIAWSCNTVSLSTLDQSGFKKSLDFPNQRLEGEFVRAGAGGDLLRVLTLALGEQLVLYPRSRAWIAKPVHVEARRQLLIQYRLELPRSEIPRGVESRIDIDERVGRIVLESCRAAQQRNVEIRQL